MSLIICFPFKDTQSQRDHNERDCQMMFKMALEAISCTPEVKLKQQHFMTVVGSALAWMICQIHGFLSYPFTWLPNNILAFKCLYCIDSCLKYVGFSFLSRHGVRQYLKLPFATGSLLSLQCKTYTLVMAGLCSLKAIEREEKMKTTLFLFHIRKKKH